MTRIRQKMSGGEGREDGEDAEKEKKIKMAPAVFTMTCLGFVLDLIKPLGFLHPDVKGWEAYVWGQRGTPRCQ